MSVPTDFSKLPKWAQAHIKNLERARDAAVAALNEFEDTQTPAPFFIDELISENLEGGPTFRKKYVQGHRMVMEHRGMRIDITLRQDDVTIQYGGEHHHMADILMQPVSFQQFRLRWPRGK